MSTTTSLRASILSGTTDIPSYPEALLCACVFYDYLFGLVSTPLSDICAASQLLTNNVHFISLSHSMQMRDFTSAFNVPNANNLYLTKHNALPVTVSPVMTGRVGGVWMDVDGPQKS